MNTPLTHSPIYAEPISALEYCPQAAAAPQMVDRTTQMILHYFQQVKDALFDQIARESDNKYKIHLLGRLYEIHHIEYILQSQKLDIPRDI